MGGGRSYGDACGTAHALDLVGERWSLLVVRELLLGAKRYSDLRAALPGISTNVLSSRLDELEAGGLVRRRRLPPPAASAVYELTEWGEDLEPILCQLGRWATRSPLHDRRAHLSVTSLVLSLRTNFDSSRAAGVSVEVQLQVADETFVARVADGRLTVERGVAEHPAATLAGEPGALAAVVYSGLPLSDAIASGDVALVGDEQSARCFLGSFVLPAPVPASAG